jgi:hypothetical protein
MTKAAAIGPNGRTVRCARCEATWFVSAEDAAQDSLDQKILEEDLVQAPVDNDVTETNDMSSLASTAPAGAHVTMRDKADAEKRARRRKVIWAIWLIPLLILLLGAALAFMFRQEIVNRIPQTATIYKSLGITVKTAGLEIESPTARMALIDGQTVLVVNSAIRNVSTAAQDVPMVQLSLHNGAGEPLAEWYVEPDKTRLAPKGRLEFASQFPDPPVDAVDLRYDFTADETGG